jgi:phosphomethylpyrimidine synthase
LQLLKNIGVFVLSIREDALNNKITDIMKTVAKDENVTPEFILEGIKKGNISVFKNKNRNTKPCATGKGLKTKVNANIGTSPLTINVELEIEKLRAAEEAGADAIMDLSIGGDVDAIRKKIMAATNLTIGTVPMYQAAFEKICKSEEVASLTKEDFLSVIEKQAKDGVDFMTIHAGITKETVARLRNEGRILDVVSRGGSLMVKWMEETGNENPYFEYYDDVLEVLREHDVVISLGDGMRPGCLADATDRAQINELIVLGELTKRAWDKGVQVIIEGPGHVPLNQVKLNMELEKRLCHEAPFYVLGPLVTDIAPGYDHLTAAIGGSIAASYGADFLCYVTPAEHLRLPTVDDVREGVIATKIAAHVGDIVKGVPSAVNKDIKMAKARKNLDWDAMFDIAIDPLKAKKYRNESDIGVYEECTMCGEFCSIRNLKEKF